MAGTTRCRCCLSAVEVQLNKAQRNPAADRRFRRGRFSPTSESVCTFVHEGHHPDTEETVFCPVGHSREGLHIKCLPVDSVDGCRNDFKYYKERTFIPKPGQKSSSPHRSPGPVFPLVPCPTIGALDAGGTFITVEPGVTFSEPSS